MRTTVTKAAIKVQTTTRCKNEPVGPNAGSGLVSAWWRQSQLITAR